MMLEIHSSETKIVHFCNLSKQFYGTIEFANLQPKVLAIKIYCYV